VAFRTLNTFGKLKKTKPVIAMGIGQSEVDIGSSQFYVISKKYHTIV